MPIYGEFVPPSQGLGSALVSNVAGGVSAWDNSVALIQNGLAATYAYGLSLQNNTPATAGVTAQHSPSLDLAGRAWNTGVPNDNANVGVRLVNVPVSSSTAYGSLRIQHQTGTTGGWYTSVRIDAQPTTAEELLDISFYRAIFWSGGYNSPRGINANAFRSVNPQTATATATFGLYFGYGYGSSGSIGTDTFSPTTAGGRQHCLFNTIYSPNAPGLASNFAAVVVNPTFSGNSGTGYATALAVALKTSVTTTGQVNIIDFGTTGTDYFTGYESKLRLTNDANSTSLYLNHQTAAKNASVTLQTAGVVRGYVAYFGSLGTGLSLYASTAIGWRVERDILAAGQEVFRVVGPADLAKTAGTERYDVYFNLARTVQWATGALTTQRSVYIEAPTYAFVGASTITNASTVCIGGAPRAGANCTFDVDNNHALWIADSYAYEEIGSALCLENTHPGIVDLDYPSPMLQFINRGHDGATEYVMRSRLRSHGVVYPTLFFGFRSNAAAYDDVIEFAYDGSDGHINVNAYSNSILHLARTARVGAGVEMFTIHTPDDTARAAGTEYNDVYWDFATHTVQWATGALATQRAVYIAAPTYAFVGASTLTNAATFYVSGAPAAGANATITNAYAAWFGAAVRIDGFIDLLEIVKPANPAANRARVYSRDNGLASPNNRTQAVILWSDGAETVIAESAAS